MVLFHHEANTYDKEVLGSLVGRASHRINAEATKRSPGKPLKPDGVAVFNPNIPL